MTDRKTIAVVGATGAQGGGLVRAILEDPSGGFAVRALTRDAESDAARALARAGRRSRRGRRRRRGEPRARLRRRPRRLLRHVLLGAPLPGEGTGAGRQPGPRGAHGGCPARHLVHARGHAPLGAPGEPSACPRSWASTRCRTSTRRARPTRSSPGPACPRRSCSPRSTGTTSSISAWGRRRDRTARSRSRCRWETRSCPASPRRTSAAAPTASSRRARPSSAGPSASPESISPARRWPRRSRRRWGSPSATTTCRRRSYRAFGFPGADDLGNMFQFKRDFEPDYCGARDVAASRALNPRLQDFAAWLAANAGRIPLD